jgi:hypothetical protein
VVAVYTSSDIAEKLGRFPARRVPDLKVLTIECWPRVKLYLSVINRAVVATDRYVARDAPVDLSRL